MNNLIIQGSEQLASQTHYAADGTPWHRARIALLDNDTRQETTVIGWAAHDQAATLALTTTDLQEHVTAASGLRDVLNGEGERLRIPGQSMPIEPGEVGQYLWNLGGVLEYADQLGLRLHVTKKREGKQRRDVSITLEEVTAQMCVRPISDCKFYVGTKCFREEPRPSLDRAEPEVWRPAFGYEGHYEVSNLGRVWRLPYTDRRGVHHDEGERLDGTRSGNYRQVKLSPNGRGKPRSKRVHTLVAETFIGPLPPGQQVRHLDGNRANNKLDNLKHGTPGKNANDKVRHQHEAAERAGQQALDVQLERVNL